MGQRRDPIVRPSLRVFSSNEGPCEGAQAILVGPVIFPDEHSRHTVLTRSDANRLGSDRNAAATVVLEGQQRNTLAVDGEIDILEGRAPAEECL